MLRRRNTITEIVANWIIMFLIVCPLVTLGLVGFFWISFKLLGAI